MNMVDALCALRDGMATFTRRRSWHRSAKLFLMHRAVGAPREIWLECVSGQHGWQPHSVDAKAQDWEIVK